MIKGKNIITVLDIGSSKISCFIIKKIYADNYEVLGVSQTASFGVAFQFVLIVLARSWTRGSCLPFSGASSLPLCFGTLEAGAVREG